jgi:hypothetical protein
MSTPIQNVTWMISELALRPDGTVFTQAGAVVRVIHQPATGQAVQLGQVPLDADGSYSVSYTVTAAGTIGGVSPTLLIQLIDARGAVLASAARIGPKNGEVVDLAIPGAAGAARPTPTLMVSGVVRQADGQPAPGVLVRAIDKDLRTEAVLAENRTDRQGRYAPEQDALAAV